MRDMGRKRGRMRKEDALIHAGYMIRNAKITSADLSMENHGCLTLALGLEGSGWGVVYGGVCIGHGYLGADTFEGYAKGIEYIMRIMDVVGVETFNDMVGKYVRVPTKGWGGEVKIIGNIMSDKWFDAEEFFSTGKDEK